MIVDAWYIRRLDYTEYTDEDGNFVPYRDVLHPKQAPGDDQEVYDAWVQAITEEGYELQDIEHERVVFVPECEWVEYVRELAVKLGYIKGNELWPFNHIDWDAAARELSLDWSTIEVLGVTYYYEENRLY